MLKLWVDKKLPNPINMLRYDLTHWLIYSHVGSLFKFWLCGYCIFAIVTRLAGPLANSRREEKGVLVFRLAQFRGPGHNVGSLFKLWLCAYAVFTIATGLDIPLRLILVRKRGNASVLDWRSFVSNGTLFGCGQYALRTIPLSASHMERIVFGNQPVFSGLASVCANVPTASWQKIAETETNAVLRPNSLTYLFTCGILIEALTKRIFNFCNSKYIYLVGVLELLSKGIYFRLALFSE